MSQSARFIALQLSDGPKDPLPGLLAFQVAALGKGIDTLSRVKARGFAVLHDQDLGAAVDVEIGNHFIRQRLGPPLHQT